MHDLTTECSFDAQATWVIDVLGLFIDMPSMVVCTTRHWETSGRLVQEINVCTVVAMTLLVRPLFLFWGKQLVDFGPPIEIKLRKVEKLYPTKCMHGFMKIKNYI